ncbi:ABC transporter ATP-binding protein (plasmid) [Pararhizobium polonicum]|uniref:ABC transporter ATP-binding protein n=1 Tax=Pararhizobium polonicum TaxID=1612624 RepID=A0A1C7PCS1_9HYPH|nr:ABC transporter ATP-binding protein [Pararhizobium polonicum]OBZ97534.1 ABC transporter ATP-binding protein [Pararhizobium polonicum]
MNNVVIAESQAASVEIRDLTVAFGSLNVIEKLNLRIDSGEFIVLLGPSGCGKSTLLNTIAGLQDAFRGDVIMNGCNVTGLEPKDRGIAMVFQSYALYPTMTVEKNLSFGLRVARMPKKEITRRVSRAAEILELTPLLKRKPSALSGGQRQRVAIGRALVREVDIFLFDEPLSNLDAQLRAELRVEIKRLHQRLGNTMIYVTHDQVEALTLADRIAVMKGGAIQQLAHPEVIYNQPANMFVAKFIGSPSMNFLAGTVVEGSLRTQGADIFLPQGSALRGDVTLGIRPENIAVGEDAQQKNVTWNGLVELREPLGGEALLWCFFGQQRVCIRVRANQPVKAGDEIPAGFNLADASFFDSTTGDRI